MFRATRRRRESHAIVVFMQCSGDDAGAVFSDFFDSDCGASVFSNFI
ncbi:hypothetical protein ABAC402_09775 [Asticcacaulis sp. AC402]|nr:hypothetical protein ABAC402_09775 [Asticcacaulis sp. AC402]